MTKLGELKVGTIGVYVIHAYSSNFEFMHNVID